MNLTNCNVFHCNVFLCNEFLSCPYFQQGTTSYHQDRLSTNIITLLLKVSFYSTRLISINRLVKSPTLSLTTSQSHPSPLNTPFTPKPRALENLSSTNFSIMSYYATPHLEASHRGSRLLISTLAHWWLLSKAMCRLLAPQPVCAYQHPTSNTLSTKRFLNWPDRGISIEMWETPPARTCWVEIRSVSITAAVINEWSFGWMSASTHFDILRKLLSKLEWLRDNRCRLWEWKVKQRDGIPGLGVWYGQSLVRNFRYFPGNTSTSTHRFHHKAR